MTYRIARKGQEIATAEEKQIEAGLSTGLYFKTDHVWCEGMADWKLAAEVFGQNVGLPLSSETKPPPLPSSSLPPPLHRLTLPRQSWRAPVMFMIGAACLLGAIKLAQGFNELTSIGKPLCVILFVAAFGNLLGVKFRQVRCPSCREDNLMKCGNTELRCSKCGDVISIDWN